MSVIRSKKQIGIGLICMGICVAILLSPISDFFSKLHFVYWSAYLGGILGLLFISWRVYCWGLRFNVKATLKRELEAAGVVALVFVISTVLATTFIMTLDFLLALPSVIGVVIYFGIIIYKILTLDEDVKKNEST